MNKIVALFITVFFIAISSLKSQERIDYFKMSGIKNHFSIHATVPDTNGNFDFYIFPISLNKEMKEVALIIDSENLGLFKKQIRKAKELFSRYNRAIEKDTLIEFNLNSFPQWKASFLNKEWNYDYSVDLEFTFSTSKKSTLFITNKSFLKSISNQNNSCKGFMFSFKTIKEIDNFLSKLNVKSVKNHYK